MAQWFGMLHLESPRQDSWLASFGTDIVPILGPEPVPFHLIGIGRNIPCYFVDLRRLGSARFDRLVAFLAEQSGENPAVIRAEILSVGLPLDAAGVTVFDLEQSTARLAGRSSRSGEGGS